MTCPAMTEMPFWPGLTVALYHCVTPGGGEISPSSVRPMPVSLRSKPIDGIVSFTGTLPPPFDAFAVGATDVVGTEAVWSDDEPPEPPDEHAVAPNSAAPATVRNPRRSMGVPSSVTCPLALRPVRAGSG